MFEFGLIFAVVDRDNVIYIEEHYQPPVAEQAGFVTCLLEAIFE